MAVYELVSEQISAAQYLRMAFEHYPEFVDGRIVERGTRLEDGKFTDRFMVDLSVCEF